ncbi:hypothetical protein BSKO_12556 [Bryopsis sp. KO-2023]|nr:hypothetical protein BSKO_05794 [Bryopsis sp. KO-2023]GMH44604.1 hypothetical protein BSKO_12556 [Bryopsis sp. KO-2023]
MLVELFICMPDKDFQTGWIKSHVEASKHAVGKPLLLEEFGRKLDGSEPDELTSIMFLRDPDFNRTYEMLESKIKARPGAFVGTLFWRWFLPSYESQGRGLYGVDPRDTTFELVKEHANFIRKVNNAQAPGEDCTTGCWVPHTRGQHRICIPAPHACKTYWEMPDKDLMIDVIMQGTKKRQLRA